MKNIFISRDLSDNSRFYELEKQGYRIINKSLIRIEVIPFEIIRTTDWIFFYSKNGIKNFFSNAPYNESCKYAVIGDASSIYFENQTGKKADFTGSGSTMEIAESLREICKNSSILFVKASNSLNSIENLIEDDASVFCHSLVVYKNKKLEDFNIDPCDILIFTSPLNAEAYFSKYVYNAQMILSIGSSTANRINELCGQKALYPESPTEEKLFDLLRVRLDLQD